MGGWVYVEPDSGEGILGFILANMAYPFMFIVTIFMCLSHKSLQNVIPGHPILSFLVLAFGAMVLTFLIMRLALIGSAFSAFCCMFILGLLYAIIVVAIGPDSVQYFILLTVIFSAISLPLTALNLISSIGGFLIPGLSYIVAGVINAHTAAFYILIIIDVWQECGFQKGDIVIEDKFLNHSYWAYIFGDFLEFASVPGAVMFYIVFAAVCLGAFAATIILGKKLAPRE